ncbi:MAG: hypothetical protein EA377_12975 [Phycisphaerales bacterium]|nr:MAG: hypothetical protein EA377_12975 [Phycisphaerales bacterium]
MSDYIVRDRLLGGLEVFYRCPACAAELRSPLTDAGDRENCPKCGISYVVPGEPELAEYEHRKRQLAKDREELEARELERRKQREREKKKAEAERRKREEAAKQAQASRPAKPNEDDDGKKIPKYNSLVWVAILLRILAVLNVAVPLIVFLASFETPELRSAAIQILLLGIFSAILCAFWAELVEAFRDHVRNGWHSRRTLAQIAERMEQTSTPTIRRDTVK